MGACAGGACCGLRFWNLGLVALSGRYRSEAGGSGFPGCRERVEVQRCRLPASRKAAACEAAANREE